MFEDLDPILIQVTIPLPTSLILAAFTDSKQVEAWLHARAVIEPTVGGRYELTFADDTPFTSRGTVTHFTPDVDIGFSWQGPPAYSEVMTPENPTHVYVRLQDSPEGIDVTLEHSGWKSGEAWEEARSWHFHLWDEALHRLKDYVLKAAYG